MALDPEIRSGIEIAEAALGSFAKRRLVVSSRIGKFFDASAETRVGGDQLAWFTQLQIA